MIRWRSKSSWLIYPRNNGARSLVVKLWFVEPESRVRFSPSTQKYEKNNCLCASRPKMKSILILNPDNVTKEVAATFKTRSAARGVVFDGNKNVALLPVAAHNYFKLPGGGIEEGEDKTEGFKEPLWLSLDKAIELMANQADNYEGKFIVERDTFLLKKVKQLGIE